MRYQVCCVRDIKADIWGQPFFQASVGMAQRTFSDTVNRKDENNLIFKHPEDFELYHLGVYNDEDGSFDLLAKPKQLLVGSSCVVDVK